MAVHREGGSAARPGGLGEEHVQGNGGGTGPGSRPHGGGHVSTKLNSSLWWVTIIMKVSNTNSFPTNKKENTEN